LRYALIALLTVLSPVLASAMVFGPPLLIAEIYDRIVYLLLRHRLRRQMSETVGETDRSTTSRSRRLRKAAQR
jgi:hypothetical protein